MHTHHMADFQIHKPSILALDSLPTLYTIVFPPAYLFYSYYFKNALFSMGVARHLQRMCVVVVSRLF